MLRAAPGCLIKIQHQCESTKAKRKPQQCKEGAYWREWAWKRKGGNCAAHSLLQAPFLRVRAQLTALLLQPSESVSRDRCLRVPKPQYVCNRELRSGWTGKKIAAGKGWVSACQSCSGCRA